MSSWIKVKDLLHKNIDGKESNTAKGENIATEFNKSKETLFNKKILRHKMKVIQDNKTSNGNIQNQQISLSCFDYKRFVLNDGIHTFAYFHKNFKK